MRAFADSAVDRETMRTSARAGPEEAFVTLVEAHRPALHAHCYRMLGSLADADDALQETLLKAWRGLAGYRGDSSPSTWLHRIATNVCLDAIRRRPKRVLPIDYAPASAPSEEGEPVRAPVWIEPYPDEVLGLDDVPDAPEARYEQREAVELAFIAALQHLPARQRSVLILRDVLGFSAREVAEVLGTTVASVNSGLHRARRSFDERRPQRSQQAALGSLGDARARDLVRRFADAFERGDVGAILALLAEDATFSMPPYAGWCHGRDAIADSWLMPGGPPPRLRYVPARVNGQLALGVYLREPARGRYLPLCLDVLVLGNGNITDVVAFRSPVSFARFGLPGDLPIDAAEEPGRR